MASVESVQPSTSNLINPLIPTTITAEILVENLPAQSQAVASSLATTVSASSASSQISTNNNNNNGSSQEQQTMMETADNNKKDSDEPEAKRRKTEHKPSKIVEKLEARLGGILCCAVCLDLPRTAMYQVKWLFHSVSLRFFSSS